MNPDPVDGTYRDLEGELLAVVLGGQGVKNRGQLGRVELDCYGELGKYCSLRTTRAALLAIELVTNHRRRHQ